MWPIDFCVRSPPLASCFDPRIFLKSAKNKQREEQISWKHADSNHSKEWCEMIRTCKCSAFWKRKTELLWQNMWQQLAKKSENGQMFRLKRSSAIDGSKYFCTTPLNAGKQRLPLNAKQSQNESPEWLIVTKKHDGKTQKWTEGLKSSSSTPLTFTIWHSDEKTWRANTGIWWDMMDRFQVKLTRNCKVWLYRSHRTAGKGSWQIDVLLTNQTRESSNFVYCAGKKIHFRL